MNKTMTWEILAGIDTAAPDAGVPPAQPEQETYRIQRITRGERRLYTPPPATVTMPRDLDAERLRDSVAALPAGLRMEFALRIDGRPSAFYLAKHTAPATHWAAFALHIDPIYGEWQNRELPRRARKWLGRTPWATALMIAHEVPAWCISTFPDPRRLPVDHLVSDISNHRVRTIDPILYGVMVAGAQWGFVPLASWRL